MRCEQNVGELFKTGDGIEIRLSKLWNISRISKTILVRQFNLRCKGKKINTHFYFGFP